MRKTILTLGLIMPLSCIYALDFLPGTEFLKANRQAECEAQGGSFIVWEEQHFCTKHSKAQETVVPSSKMLEKAFEDVELEHSNADAIGYVKALTIVQGYDDGTFKPTKNLNRAELVKIVVKANFEEEEILECDLEALNFVDVRPEDWFAPYVCLAEDEDIVSGYADGTFQPAKKVNFVEAAKIITKSFGYEMADVGEVWYQGYVETLGEQNAIPVSIEAFDKEINRGEVSEMIYRLKAKMNNKASRTYSSGELLIK